MLTGDPGTGKSIALRLLIERLRVLPGVVGRIEHPQSRTLDFYRELGDVFGLALAAHNRWAGFKALRIRLDHLLDVAGNPSLMTSELKATLVDHAAGNYRVMMNLADELLAVALDRDLPRLDEKLYLEVFGQPQKTKAAARKR
jgi:hypothetical protein